MTPSALSIGASILKGIEADFLPLPNFIPFLPYFTISLPWLTNFGAVVIYKVV